MSSTFPIRILHPAGVFYEGPCESVIVHCSDGMRGIKAHHSNLISVLEPGMMTYRLPGQEDQIAAVSSGMVKVEDGEVLILAESIERPEEIDENKNRRQEEQAREAMLQRRSIDEYKLAQLSLARAANRLRVKSRSGKI